EVFQGTLDFLFPHLDETTRTLAVRFHVPNPGHRLRPGTYATVKVDVPPSRVATIARALAEDLAVVSAADALAGPAFPGAGSALLPGLYAAGRQAALQCGLLPSVPDGAVIDTGSLKVVYREAGPGTFEGVAVQLGPRMTPVAESTAYYPVLRGL